MILLERLLAGLDVGVEPFAVCDVRGEDRLTFDRDDGATVHYTLAGAGVLRIGDGAPLTLNRHDFVVVPPRQRQRIEAGGGRHATLPARACRPLGEGLRQIAVGDGERGVVMACGVIRVTYRRTTGLFDYLREPIVESFADDPPVRRAFETFLAEMAAPRPGTRALAEAVMKQCLVVLLRRHCASGECRVPWLTALEDPRLGAVVAAMLDDPAAPLTVAGLADIAGMSRSTFAAHFVAAFGRPPMDFIKELRLRRAARLLVEGDLPIKSVARAVGYDSRSYFSRAFKARYGVDPARFRATGGVSPPTAG